MVVFSKLPNIIKLVKSRLQISIFYRSLLPVKFLNMVNKK